MYHWVEDKDYLKRAYGECAGIVNQLVQRLKKKDIKARMNIVGSKSRKMVTQNGRGKIDFDFNLIIVDSGNIKKCEKLKDTIMKVFNEVLKDNGWPDCKDSTSALTTKEKVLEKGNKTPFSIDVCIVKKDNEGNWYRLIHKKTGDRKTHQWMWEKARNSKDITEKAKRIKSKPGKWKEVRKRYLDKKNMYLKRQDKYHKSFICYIEAVNEVYSTIK